MKKFNSILIAVFVAAAIGAACGGGSKTPASTQTMPTDNGDAAAATGGDSYGGAVYGGAIYGDGGAFYGM